MNTESNILQIPSLGIDVGYRATKIAFRRSASAHAGIECMTFRSHAPAVFSELETVDGAPAMNVATISVGQNRHIVGPDAHSYLPARTVHTVSENYARTGEYAALLKGSLLYAAKNLLQKDSRICTLRVQNLVCGLPLNTLKSHAAHVRALATGTHHLPPLFPGSEEFKVEVSSATVLAQPHGGLIGTSSVHPSGPDFLRETTLVLDIGGGTVDWFCATRNKPDFARCGGFSGGMLTIAAAVSDRIKAGLRDDPIVIQRIDEAISQKLSSVKISGQAFSLTPHEPEIQRALSRCVEKMVESVGSTEAIDNFLITGGGAVRLSEQFSRMHPARIGSVIVDQEPVYSNARGFFIAGELLHASRQ